MSTAPSRPGRQDKKEVVGDIDFTPQPDLARLDQLSPRTERRTDRYTRRPAR